VGMSVAVGMAGRMVMTVVVMIVICVIMIVVIVRHLRPLVPRAAPRQIGADLKP